MSAQAIRQQLAGMAAQRGVLGCAMVDGQTGMVLEAAGTLHDESVAEAASDYWRLTQRRTVTFGTLGGVRAQVVIHQHARLTIVACGTDLLLVCVSGEPDRVDWPAWRAGVGTLQRLAHAL